MWRSGGSAWIVWFGAGSNSLIQEESEEVYMMIEVRPAGYIDGTYHIDRYSSEIGIDILEVTTHPPTAKFIINEIIFPS